jgi:hypothetical protein
MMPAWSGRELMAQLEEPAIGCCWLGLGLGLVIGLEFVPLAARNEG